MPWREALSLILSYPVWYDDGPDKLLNIDAPRFSLGFDSFEALSPRQKMNLANIYSAPGISSGPLGLEIDPGEVKRPFVLSELFSLIWSTRTTALKAFLILRRVSTK